MFMHALEYIDQLLSLLWLSRTFSNRANLGASYPKSYRINIMAKVIGKSWGSMGLPSFKRFLHFLVHNYMYIFS